MNRLNTSKSSATPLIQPSGKQIKLKDLCPEDKTRVGDLVKKLA